MTADFLQHTLKPMMSGKLGAVALSLALALASAAHPRVLAPEAIDARLESLEAKVNALSRNGEDAPNSVVKERTDGKFESCADVAAAGLCKHRMAEMGCAQSCGKQVLHAENGSAVVTALKRDDDGDGDDEETHGSGGHGTRCSFDSDCEKNLDCQNCEKKHESGYWDDDYWGKGIQDKCDAEKKSNNWWHRTWYDMGNVAFCVCKKNSKKDGHSCGY